MPYNVTVRLLSATALKGSESPPITSTLSWHEFTQCVDFSEDDEQLWFEVMASRHSSQASAPYVRLLVDNLTITQRATPCP